MRTIYKLSAYIFTAILCCLVSSCADDDIIDSNKITEGKPVQVALTFNVNASEKIESRAAQSTYYEYLVQNIYIFIFNNGERVDLEEFYFEQGDIENYENKEDQYQHTESSGTIDFGAISGSNMKICAIANIGTSNSQIDKATLDNIKSYDELTSLTVSLKENTISRGASFLMTGEETVSLQPDKTTEVTIRLKRTDSKITFNVVAEAESQGITDMQFIPGKWRVVNVPTATWVLPREINKGETLTEDKDAASEESEFFDIEEANMPQFEGSVNNTSNSGTFTFYMYENLKKPNGNITDYALREKQTKTPLGQNATGVSGQRFVNGDYVYAPKYGTYVVFTGELTYTDNSDKDNPKYVIADVEYCVHLGHSGTDNVNDYSTLRNHHYTYHVTITGVNSLIIEVDSNDGTEDREERPGAEGDVVISSAQIINVDAHYDRAIFSLSEEEAKKIYFSVSTPWERGLDANGFSTSGTLKDYKWVKFLINKEAKVTEKNYYAPYPGEQCYDGGKTDTGTSVTSPAYNGEAITLRDVRQLSKFLFVDDNRNAVKSDDGRIYITAFVDEYLYFYDPTTDPLGNSTTYKGVTQGTDVTSLAYWKRSVNQNDRMLHIVKSGDMKYSADGETSVSRSVVTFKQRPILSFYNVGAEGLTSAWGTETINETPRMTVTRSSYPTKNNNNDYAYSQILTANNGSNSWANVISSSEQYGLGDNYKDPSYACALRNRDLDGDGKIDNNEVQWYLASLDQMSDLWIGEPCMPEYAHLYDEDNPDGYYQMGGYSYAATHYITSSIGNGVFTDSSPYVYWAEEYGSNSAFSRSVGWGQSPMKDGTVTTNTSDETYRWNSDKNNAIVSLRCVRNLGRAYTSTELPQDYIALDGNKISLEYMNPAALRSAFDNNGPLPVDILNTKTENNRPYSSFEVYSSTSHASYYSQNKWYNYYAGEKYNDYTPNNDETSGRLCPDEWRVPNQREMLIMSNTISEGWSGTWVTMLNYQITHDKYNSISKIGAFFLYVSENRMSRNQGGTIESYITTETENLDQGYLLNSSYSPTGYNAGIRCVRDVK